MLDILNPRTFICCPHDAPQYAMRKHNNNRQKQHINKEQKHCCLPTGYDTKQKAKILFLPYLIFL